MRSLSQVCFAVALLVTLFAGVHETRAQVLGNQVFEPDSFRQVATDINVGLPGRLWVRTTAADQGLGFDGSFATLGLKTHLFEDSWNGRWLGETRLHYSIDNEEFFGNFGIERVFTLESAKADLVTGFWADYDGDTQGNFSNDFSQVSANVAVRTEKWDLVGNGYFPVGITDFTTAGPNGDNFFLGSNIVLTPGIDSALRGFDVTLRMRPKFLSFGNGIIDFGGYGYSSELIDFFSGGRARLGFQLRNGASIVAEVNHDDRFNTTGSLGFGWAFGPRGSARGSSGGIGRDLAETVRNDHIVRFNQGFELAIDPATGLAFNVRHVNNTADAAFGNGTFETPYTSLAAAEAGSDPGDIILVSPGDGSRQGLDTGIVLQDRQTLLGTGGDLLIPLQGGGFFPLTGSGPNTVISNPGGTDVITLANENIIRGIDVDATGAENGIRGSGVVAGNIENVNVSGAGNDGLSLENIAGDWVIENSSFNANGAHGIHIDGFSGEQLTFLGNTTNDNILGGIFVENASNSQTIFNFANNIANGNGFDGIHLQDFLGQQLSLVNNTTNNNGRHGLFIERFLGQGLDLDIVSHTATGNAGTGIFLEQGDGDVNIVDATVSDNAINGIQILNWTNSLDGDSTFIGNTLDGATNISDNLSNNILIELTNPNQTQDVLITGTSIIGGGRGIFASVAGANTILNVSILDNISISQHLTDGLRFDSVNGGELNVLVENTGAPLILNDNGQVVAGTGISFVTDGDPGEPASQINAIVRNISINNDLESGFASTVIVPFGPDGIFVNGTGTSRINLEVEDSRIESAGGLNINVDNNGGGDVNNFFFRNLTIRADSGVILNSLGGSFVDFALISSDIQSNGLVRTIATGGTENDPTEGGDPFLDGVGNLGFAATVVGDFGGPLDNLTRIQFTDNVIRDFTFDAVTIDTFGDAQLLAFINSNEILRNGPGVDNLIEFPDNPMTNAGGVAPVNENELNFFDGVELNANGASQVSLRFGANTLVNNSELGIELNTFGTATINAVIDFNTFANDTGQDADATTAGVATSFLEDFQANNNIAGTMCLALSTNTFQSAANFNQNSLNPFTVELDGATNGFTDAALAPGIVTGSVGICEGLISDEELFFAAAGFVDADTPPGGGFAPIGRE